MIRKLFTPLFTPMSDAGMLDPGRAVNIAHYALQCSELPGAMVEFGCYNGCSSAVLAVVADKPLYVYDSFEGLPERAPQDVGAHESFKAGSLAVGEHEIHALFAKYDLRKPIVWKLWFNQVGPEHLPESICFAYLDGDFYTSIRDSLSLVYPRMVPGAACIIDDYGWEALSGVKIAVDEYMADKPEKVKQLVTGNPSGLHAVFIKI